MARFPFPRVLDSTILASFRACCAKGMMAYVEHWKPNTPSVHLHAGAAYAHGLERARRSFYEAGNPEAVAVKHGLLALNEAYGAFQTPEGSNKTRERMTGALEFYFGRYPMSQDPATPHVLPSGRRAIEFSYAAPLPVLHPESDEPILYSGRADMLVDYAQGVYLLDDKTTSALGGTWISSWDLRSQFSGYCWLAQHAGFMVKGVLVRGVSILKTKYDTLQAITHREPWMIERWLRQTVRDAERMILAWETGQWDYNLDESCTAYGGCQFKQVCVSEDPKPWLEMNFTRRRWDPLARTELPVESSQ